MVRSFSGVSCRRVQQFSRSCVLLSMRFMLLIAAWCILFVLCWPVALLALVLAPIVWVIVLPFRIVGICLHAALALLRAVLMLPARLLGLHGSSGR